MSAGRVAWISVTPVKSLGLVHVDEVQLEHFGVRGNRRFHLVDTDGNLINGKRHGPLVQVRSEFDEATGTFAPA